MDKKKLTRLVGASHLDEIQNLLGETEQLPDNIQLKNPRITLFLSIFLGMFGIDRLYQSGVKLFLYKIAMLLLTLETWWIADIGYSIPTTQELNYKKITAAL